MLVAHAIAAAPSAAASTLSILTALPPEAALGRAAAQLMARPAFSRTPFGHLARALAG
jgi:hypothetical protein